MKFAIRFSLIFFLGFNFLLADQRVCLNQFENVLKAQYQKDFLKHTLPNVWLRHYEKKPNIDIFNYGFRKWEKNATRQPLEFWMYFHKSDQQGGLTAYARTVNSKKQFYDRGGVAYEFFSGKKRFVKELTHGNPTTIIFINNEKIEIEKSVFLNSSLEEYIGYVPLKNSDECIKIDQYPNYDSIPKIQVGGHEKGLKLPDGSTIVRYSLLYGNPGDSEICRSDKPLHYGTYSDAYIKQDKKGNTVWKKVFIPYPGETSNAFFSVLPDNTALIRQSDSTNISVVRINLCTGDSKADKNKFIALDAEMVERYIFDKMKQGESYNGVWEDEMESGVVKNTFLMNLAFPSNGKNNAEIKK